ncbi:hypothetical protein BU14_0562s0002 [Porphyra umbilicalis]|uniref:Uncharacterized protein n=1 Tax=Porphyra umbilicalis TaxID=2786 RepID=A0A1X6NRN8_PORUM|nr:hypothetical protein BU14_0562s0002 [Porphyra umbilicalis]|eukprot:OSX71289.1 hypothetical protein BU14_0562s0002 [Porphyra umbilicalis]
MPPLHRPRRSSLGPPLRDRPGHVGGHCHACAGARPRLRRRRRRPPPPRAAPRRRRDGGGHCVGGGQRSDGAAQGGGGGGAPVGDGGTGGRARQPPRHAAGDAAGEEGGHGGHWWVGGGRREARLAGRRRCWCRGRGRGRDCHGRRCRCRRRPDRRRPTAVAAGRRAARRRHRRRRSVGGTTPAPARAAGPGRNASVCIFPCSSAGADSFSREKQTAARPWRVPECRRCLLDGGVARSIVGAGGAARTNDGGACGCSVPLPRRACAVRVRGGVADAPASVCARRLGMRTSVRSWVRGPPRCVL